MVRNTRQEILDFIIVFTKERGYPPTIREIGKAVGVSSPSTVHHHLQGLVRSGAITVDPTKPRTIVVTGGGS